MRANESEGYRSWIIAAIVVIVLVAVASMSGLEKSHPCSSVAACQNAVARGCALIHAVQKGAVEVEIGRTCTGACSSGMVAAFCYDEPRWSASRRDSIE